MTVVNAIAHSYVLAGELALLDDGGPHLHGQPEREIEHHAREQPDLEYAEHETRDIPSRKSGENLLLAQSLENKAITSILRAT
ncbi:hypothetical protein CBM2634_A10131 [Cupriavidus taiwanensis]|uniref:Uncharacterized protein n=1 Tax=Cupriavidus taiwanensis TaxID=164546 RepID=A0A375ITM9_9BURK|nr:hypothetical protein CBM2634_A10131 [Cupriavidus taiwanensis]